MKAAVFLMLLAASAMAQQVRVTLRVIEVPHPELTKWTAGEKLPGSELHERAVKLALAGGAEIVDTNVLIARSGEKALTESIAEVIYPTEWEPPDLGGAQLPLDAKQEFPPILRPSDFSFETRHAGTLLEIEPMVSEDGGFIDLRLAFEMVDLESLATWMEFRDEWGDASVKMPIFDTRRLTSAITLVPGTFELFNVFTPKPAAVPAAATRQLVFVKADVLPVSKP
ncbi:hypothetical protein OKA05_18365 [Luteolibacter arcticus]|uniref:Peptidoglycan-binding protein CsiV n=1 Tax=Luteolibacter arcticus TaxID=1581411 RepID=A0ABT3GM29_9BACT|nr:hypothetical protein [Luteolibacter arcticus]MCW1924536.1 hypothetical protein [Luteolibacter arcticus]